MAKARAPERCAKIAAARRGKPRPKHIQAILKAQREGPVSDAARRNMSEAQRRRGARLPKDGRAWTEEEDTWLRTLSTAEMAKRSGRTVSAIRHRRHVLGLPDGRRKLSRTPRG